MLKAITHFEQVSLVLVAKIIERENQREAEASHEKNKPNPETSLPATKTTNLGALRDESISD
jgi:hypothetical protein